MKIALAQMNVQAGQVDLNLLEMKRMIDEAVNQNADLIVFPEMCVGGYLISDVYLQAGRVKELLDANDLIRTWSSDIGIIWGNLSQDSNLSNNRDGRFNRLNTAFFARKGKWVEKEGDQQDGRYFKHCLPDYRFFDDSRYFKSGMDIALETGKSPDALIEPFIFEHAGKSYRIGLEVCEDLWSKDYLIDPTATYVNKSVDFIVNISTSPWTYNKEFSRTKRIREHVENHGVKMVPLIYLNACGMQNTGKNVLMFDGGSTVYAKDGSVIAGCRDDFQSELKIIELDKPEVFTATQDKLMKAILGAIQEFDRQIFKQRVPWIIGLSGGIDSSINAALLVMALGKDRVKGFNLASRFNRDETKSIARVLADDLGIEFREGSIEALVDATHSTLDAYGFEVQETGLGYENIQARLRGHLLSSFAAYHKGVVCNNGNKVELALGYATLYGDTIGALSPLGDCTKLQIFELAKSINRIHGKALIDEVLIPSDEDGKPVFRLPPSAELKDNQVDPMKWGYHDWLVQYLIQYPTHAPIEWLNSYLDGSWRETDVASNMIAYGLDDPEAFITDFRWFTRAWQSGIFKRIQFPPIVTLSRGSFGFDYRESQLAYVESEAMSETIQSILNLKRAKP